MAMLDMFEMDLKKSGGSVTVPGHPAAKLMYYLDCMCTVLKLDDDDDINRLRDYDKYYTLTHADRDMLIHLCSLLKPDVLLNKCIFQDDALCGEKGNQFYELETVRNQLLVAGIVMIGGRQRRVNNIMAFKMSWLSRNWTNPMEELIARQEREKSTTCIIL